MRSWVCTCVGLLLTSTASAQEKGISVTVTIEKALTAPTPICVPLMLTGEQGKWDMVHALVGKNNVWGQLTAPGIVTAQVKSAAQGVRRDLYFVLDKLGAGTVTLTFALAPIPDVHIPHFHWNDLKGRHADLLFDKRPVLRYMYEAFDDSTPDRRNLTYKVFHHLFDPSGKRLVTNGGHTNEPVGDPKKLLYPHHRGLQMGWNKCIYADGKKKADTWHCQKDDYQSHEGFLNVEAGPILGRHRVAIDWHGDKKQVFAKEEREFTVYHVPGGTLVEFASRVKTAGGKVLLQGDPQHAGFQFRAHNDVAALTAKQTYYLRPDGKGKPGETRNWDPKTKKGPIDLPWNAMCFLLNGKRYTVCYLDHPQNPGERRHSERDYGRFGCYFEYALTEDHPLTLNYRIWLQDGEMTAEQVQAISTAFTAPPKVAVK